MTWKTVSGAAKGAVLREAARLFRDKRGNSLAIIAAAIFPMLAAIGGGLDVARAYLVKSRINEACDSAALAGRRAMSNDDISTATAEATKFFNQNFPQGYLSSAEFTPAITKPETGTVRIAAQTTVPTTLMRLFGYTSLPVKVTCNATQNFDNIDIVVVLDMSGTMRDSIGGQRKIDAVKDAVLALYDELKPAQDLLAAQGLRLRYGFVPYNATVNVGKLVRSVNPSYIDDHWKYQSRRKLGSAPYEYLERDIYVSGFAAGDVINTRTIVGGSGTVNRTWNGCIEERKTVPIAASSGTAYGNIPSGAYDLNIDMVPTSDRDTKWGPQFPDIVYYPSDNDEGDRGDEASYSCPPEARLLAEITDRSTLQTYVDSAVQNYLDNEDTMTGTYHDVGMIWAARLASRGGIFAASNPAVYNDRPVNRYIIYLTDGEPQPESAHSSAYGLEYLAQRINGGDRDTPVEDGTESDLAERHSVRFEMACSAAKQGGTSIWTMAFGKKDSFRDQDLARLERCASNKDQAAVGTGLIAKFKEIAKNIGTLRISQ